MTIIMQDAVYKPSLSHAYAAVAGYVDGYYPTAAYILANFPDVYHLFYTTGLGGAEGIDVEPGNEGWNDNFAAVPGWIKGRIAAGVVRPVVYLPASAAPEMILVLAGNGVPRSSYRLFTAHWTGQEHFCSSQDTSSGFAWQADATQFAGAIGGNEYGYDLSICSDTFFTPSAAPVPVVKPTPKPVPEPEEDTLENLVEASGKTAPAGNPAGKYPAVAARQVYVIDPSRNIKYEIFGQALPLYEALIPTARQYLNAKARPCAEIAAVPST